MSVCVNSARSIGIKADSVTVEVSVGRGVGIYLVGMADVAVKESLLRIITALRSMGFKIPGQKIVVNLAPADLRKHGGGYDLPIALGLLAASEQLDSKLLKSCLIMGELSLDGSVRPVTGVLPAVDLAYEKKCSFCIFPYESAIEAATFSRIPIYGVHSLGEALSVLKNDDRSRFIIKASEFNSGGAVASRMIETEKKASVEHSDDFLDFADIKGQQQAKYGLEVAAAGGHNIIIIGPPGSGKSSLARALVGILPPMSIEESELTRKIYSVVGEENYNEKHIIDSALYSESPSASSLASPSASPSASSHKSIANVMFRRPFRSPHYSATIPALIGGGTSDNIVPGEVSLAHGGVLFLDEFCQIKKDVLDALRGPIEDRKVFISRLRRSVEFPASFMLVAAANPCACGYFGEGNRCVCTPAARMSYRMRLNGPILDRIDVQVWIHNITTEELMADNNHQERSSDIALRVAKARKIQRERFKNDNIFTNAEMNNRQIEKYCHLSEQSASFLSQIMDRDDLSARSYFRILRLSRTIADLSGHEQISSEDISKACSLRVLERPEV